MASINYLDMGMSVGVESTMIYSLEHGTEGILTTLEDASWIRKDIILWTRTGLINSPFLKPL